MNQKFDPGFNVAVIELASCLRLLLLLWMQYIDARIHEDN